MKKSLASRIAGLAALYCVIFVILVVVQFSGKGNFSLSAGAMTIRGRYLQTEQEEEISGEENTVVQRVTGGIKIFFGGLEFNLKDEREKGLLISYDNGILTAVNPEYMTIDENSVLLGLAGENTLEFYSFESARGPELHITAQLAENVTEVTIPITLRRSSLVHDNGQPLVLYSGSQYSFVNPYDELENGKLVLSQERAVVSYRAKPAQKAFDPEDYVIAQARNYESVLENWRNSSYTQWNQNTASLQNEDEIIAYLSETLRRGGYPAAVTAVSRNFINTTRQSYRSSVFIGGMTGAYRSFIASENEKSSYITGLTREGSLELFKEEHILDYLFSRNNTALAADVISIMQRAEAEMISSDYCPGVFEAYSDFKRYRPTAENPLEHLIDQALLVVSENLNYDSDNDLLFASASENGDPEYSMRLGMALIGWAPPDSPWAAIGHSLVLSVLSIHSGDGKLYNMLNLTDYRPRAASLSDSLWVWTASPSVTATTINGNLNIAFSFPVASSHFIIIRGVRPFVKIQIHDMDWRTDGQFERYDSSGWIYYSQEQTLILKMRHRTQVENIRIFYSVTPAPVPVPVPAPPPVEEAPVNTEPQYNLGDSFGYYY